MNRRDFSRRSLALGLGSIGARAGAQDPDFYQEAAKRLPVRRFDVVVAGGGTAGVVAALAAARQGAKTVLLENKGYTGGVAVEGGTALHSFFNLWKAFPGVKKRQVVKGIPQEIVDRLIRAGGCTGHAEMLAHYDYDSVCTAIDTEIYKWRHLIENLFGKLKEFKRIALRAEKTDQSFAAMIHLAAAVINSR